MDQVERAASSASSPFYPPWSHVTNNITRLTGITQLYRDRYFQDETFEALQLIEPVVAKNNLTLIETALRWVVHHSVLKLTDGGNDGIIIGVSSLSQLETNLKDLEKGPLPDEVVEALDQAWNTLFKGRSPSYWR